MKACKITAMRRSVYADLSEQYENPIEHSCNIQIGDTFYAARDSCPKGMCESAWESVRPFALKLLSGEGNFFDGWMKNPYSAMLSCNDGFRPVSFYLELTEVSDDACI